MRSLSRVALLFPRMMVNIRFTILILCMTRRGSSQDTNVKIYDDYGDEADMMYYGSIIEFQCKCRTPSCRNTSVSIHLTLDKKSINSTNDKKHGEIVKFAFTVDEHFRMGEYQCFIDQYEDWTPIKVEYRLCADHETHCQNSDACNGKFCMVRKTGFYACSTPNKTDCKIHRLETCTTANMAADSPCEAYAQNQKILTTSVGRSRCDDSYLINFRNEADQRITLGSTIYWTSSMKIRIKCGGEIRNTITVQERSAELKEPLWIKMLDCGNIVPINGNRRNHFKTKLSASTTLNDDRVLKTYIYVISLEKPVLASSLPNAIECAPNSTRPNFSCVIRNYEAHQLKYLRVTMKAAHLIVGELNSTEGELNLTGIPVIAAGKYVCQAEVVYRMCSPFSEYKVEGQVKVLLHKSCLPKSVKSVSVKIVEDDPTNTMILYAVIGGVSLIALLAICVITASVYRQNLKSKQERLRQPELEKTLNESNPANEGLILSGETLFQLSQYLMNPANNFKNAKDYVQKYLGSFDKEMSASLGKIVPVEGARYSDIPCYRHSQVRGMHINRMTDWKLRPLFIAMAPMPPVFARFWELIILEKIGTVVWIGDSKEGDQIRIDPYIDVKHGAEKIYKNDENLAVTVKTISVKDIPESQYSAYAVEVVVNGSKDIDAKPRRVIVIHVREWPDRNIAQDASAARLHQTCAMIETFHDVQAKEHRTPGLLFHCSAGVQRSAAMLALYIGRQIFVERKKINLIGVLKYVRMARYGAFLLPARGFMQVPIVLGGLVALQMSVQDEDLAAERILFTSGTPIEKMNYSMLFFRWARPFAVARDEKAVLNALLTKRPTIFAEKTSPYRTEASSKSTSAGLSYDTGSSGGGRNTKASTAGGGLATKSKSYDVLEVSAFKVGENSTSGRKTGKKAPTDTSRRKKSQALSATDADVVVRSSQSRT